MNKKEGLDEGGQDRLHDTWVGLFAGMAVHACVPGIVASLATGEIAWPAFAIGVLFWGSLRVAATIRRAKEKK